MPTPIASRRAAPAGLDMRVALSDRELLLLLLEPPSAY
jgi:hypothetical protein